MHGGGKQTGRQVEAGRAQSPASRPRRYGGSGMPHDTRTMAEIKALAQKNFAGPVTTARDFLRVRERGRRGVATS